MAKKAKTTGTQRSTRQQRSDSKPRRSAPPDPAEIGAKLAAPKRYEASVKSATELAEALLRVAPLPMALLDATLRIRAANAPFLDLLEIRADGTQGRLLTEVVETGAGFERLQQPPDRVDVSAASVPVQLYARNTSSSISFDARWFSAYDGTSGGLVLLSRNNVPGVASN